MACVAVLSGVLWSRDLLPMARAAAVHIQPVSQEFCEDMKRHGTLTETGPVKCQRLAVVDVSFWGFDDHVHDDGKIVVMDALAEHVAKIFQGLLDKRFPLEMAKPLNLYEGNDEASMADNNTSAFNDRPIAGSRSLSLHAYGAAIDVNPIQNPFVQSVAGAQRVSPKRGERYLKRSDKVPGMAEDIVDVFADNGFSIWGGDWHNPTDFQHFQIRRDLAEQMARGSSQNAAKLFEEHVAAYTRCRQSGKSRKDCVGKAPS